MGLNTFLAVLLVYRHNFQILHWMANGESFLTIHEQAQKYYELLTKDIDTVAEIYLRYNNEIVNYKDAYDLIEDSDRNFLLVTGNDFCDMKSFVFYSEKMFNDLKDCIESLLTDQEQFESIKSVGAKSELENMHNEYDLQSNYIVKRLGIDKK